MTISVPAWARDAVKQTHSAQWRATLTPVTGAPLVLPITAGALSIDSDQWPRYTCDLALGDLSLAPTTGAGAVLPFGSTVTLDYTLADSAGQTVTIRPAPPMLVDTVEVGRGRSVGMRLTASDRSLAISTDAYPLPTALPAAHRTVSTAIAYLIRRTYPTATIVDTVNSNEPLGEGFTVDADPWATIEQLADSVEAEVYLDPANRFFVRPVSVPTSAADTLATGPTGTVVGSSSTLTRGYNRVILAYRDAAGKPVLGRWADTSGGPLDIRGKYGRVTLAEARDRYATQTQADYAARAYARRVAGRVRDSVIEAVGMPWIECGDTVAVVLPSGRDDLVLSAVEHDLLGTEPSLYRFRTDTVGPV